MPLESIAKSHRLDAGPSPAGWLGLKSGLEAGQLLKEALLEWTGSHAAAFEKWAARVVPPDPAEIPAGLLGTLPSFDDSRLDELAFSEHYIPISTPWVPKQPQQDLTPLPVCIRHAFDTIQNPSKRVECEQWVQAQAADLLNIQRHGVEAVRVRPATVVVSQADLYPWARNRIIDCTFATSECCVPLDLQRDPPTHLNIEVLRRELEDYPDRTAVAGVLEGVRLDAHVELQAVLMPHLASLPLAMGSVGKELNRMAQPPLNWYGFFKSPPYWPCYFNGNGAVERKLEKNRHRRTTEGGGPRRPTFDNEGLRVLSLNQASRLLHTPRHFDPAHFKPRGSAEEQLALQRWLRANGMPTSPEELARPLEERLRKSKFPLEV